MDEIQNNPNVPDDIKAALSGAILDDDLPDADESEIVEPGDSSVEAMILEKYDDLLMDDSDEDDERKTRRRRKGREDDEWFASERQRKDHKRRTTAPKTRGRPKRKSEEGTDEASANKSRRRAAAVKKRNSDGDLPSSIATDPAKPKIERPKSVKAKSEKPKFERPKAMTKKQPPPLPFSLLDLSKKFEGKIPSLKTNNQNGIRTPVTDSTASTTASGSITASATTTAACSTVTSTTTATTTVSTTTTTTTVKHERKQPQSAIWRNNGDEKPKNIGTNYFKHSAITYPDPKNLFDKMPSAIGKAIIDPSTTLSKLMGTSSDSRMDPDVVAAPATPCK